MSGWAYLGILYLSLFLLEKGNRLQKKYDFFEQYSFLNSSVTKQMIEDQRQLIRLEAERSKNRRQVLFYSLFEESELAECCCSLAIAQYYTPQIGNIIEKISGIRLVTVETGFILLYQEDFSDYIDEIDRANRILSILFCTDFINQDGFRTGIKMDLGLLECLAGDKRLDSHIRHTAAAAEPVEENSILIYKQELDKLAERILLIREKGHQSFAIHIFGEQLSGKKYGAVYLAQRCGLRLLMVNFEKALAYEEQEEKYLLYLFRNLLLTDISVCFYHVKTDSKERKDFLGRILERAKDLKLPYFLLSETEQGFSRLLEGVILQYKISRCSGRQSAVLWKFFLEKYFPGQADKLNISVIASAVSIPVGLIEMVVRQLYMNGEELTQKNLFQACFALNTGGYESSIQEIQAAYQMEELKISPEEKGVLVDICNQVRFRVRVFEEWGMQKQYPYGRGVSALFHGPPGTGKTMAAHVIANELHLKLLRVDLSQVIDKYIGETEKRLKYIFETAEASNAVLFFDEADAIMGKRSEVKNSLDRYSNVEVSYLLQRIEEYHGIVILATNFMENMDNAFGRRIRYHVQFSMPDKKQRKEIWDSLLNAGAPVGEVDTVFLAEKFELSGAAIKNIYLNALFQAAAAEGVLEMKQILCCIAKEYRKEGRKWRLQDFEEYAFYLQP